MPRAIEPERYSYNPAHIAAAVQQDGYVTLKLSQHFSPGAYLLGGGRKSAPFLQGWAATGDSPSGAATLMATATSVNAMKDIDAAFAEMTSRIEVRRAQSAW
jgi:hypothetical protein